MPRRTYDRRNHRPRPPRPRADWQWLIYELHGRHYDPNHPDKETPR